MAEWPPPRPLSTASGEAAPGGSIVTAFDRDAAGYDEGFGRNPIGLVFRHVFQERLRRLLPAGARLLDLGCGTGEDARVFASLGFRVHAIDAAPAMIEQARAKAAGIPEEHLRFEQRAVEELAGLGEGYDAAYSDFGALNCADLRAVGAGLAAVLRPGARVLLSLMGRWPLPALVERALTGRGEARGRSAPRVAGLPVTVDYPTPAEARARLGPGFEWSGGFALGVVVPGPGHALWAWRHPQMFGGLALLEGFLRDLPIFRSLGDHVVLEGKRR
jgi:SAM-dependent methyltransferase